MSAPSSVQPVTFAFSQPAIEEDLIVLKALSCIPILGAFLSVCVEFSLVKKLENTTSVPKLIELINIKNQYKIINVGRNMLTVALVIAGMAYGIIVKGVLTKIFLAGLLIGIAINLYGIKKNNQLIKELQTSGLKAGMQAL